MLSALLFLVFRMKDNDDFNNICIVFLQAEQFGKIISQLAEQEGVTEDKIMLSFSDYNILGYDTPISVNLNVADIIGEFEIHHLFLTILTI